MSLEIAQRFKHKFESIPDVFWKVGGYTDLDDEGRVVCCAMGHCDRDGGEMTAESIELIQLFDSHFDKSIWDQFYVDPNDPEHKLHMSEKPSMMTAGGEGIVVAINDGRISHFSQDTPRGRILAALEEIIKKES